MIIEYDTEDHCIRVDDVAVSHGSARHGQAVFSGICRAHGRRRPLDRADPV